MPNTYTELRRTVVGTATNSVTLDLTGISGYTDLVLVINNTHSTNAVDGWFRLNGDTGSNYSRTNLSGDGSSAVSGRNSNVAFGYGILTLTTPSTNILQFMNYANTTTFKTVLMRSNNAGSGGYVQATVDLWRNTNAITSIEIGCVSGNYAVGSTFSLYGIANADQGAAKATGGIITEDATYWYHTFGASSAFIPKQSLTCDVLVVAGGGGGGWRQNAGGGGGAGGLRSETQSLIATSYAVTVGAGGVASTGSQVVGGKGNNSVFNTTTSTGGGGGGSGFGGSGGNAATGGSGGGGWAIDGTNFGLTGAAGNQGSYSPVEGFAGGNGTVTSSFGSAGGGGGSAAIGSNGATTGGAGGAGSSAYSSWGLVTGTGQNVSGTVYYAGGGGGGRDDRAGNNAGGAGGIGGGGRGGGQPGDAQSGAVNTGSGGGGGYNGGSIQSTGGSGLVIVRYAK
jgi:hypothetical protein